jgi:hypothetical protein
LLGWNAVTGALSYNIRYRSMNSATWLTTTSNTNSKQIGNLSPGTPHEFQVQAVCAGTNGAVVTSAFSQSYIFTTMTILNLYPNPGGNMVKLSAGSDSDETAVVEIRDMFGNLVYQSQMRLHSGVNEQDVNTSMLKDGMYSVTMHTNSAVHSTRLVIRH